MIRKFVAILSVVLLAAVKLNGQSIDDLDDLKLSGNEIPQGYSLTDEDNCISIQVCIFYKNPEMYEMIIGKLKTKQIQNFDSENDKGSIMYFEFENDFEREDFLKGLLWGGSKPSKEHPEEIYVKGKFLIIWSFQKNSEIVKKSKEKIKKILKQ
ncbi:MAG: hypothetical protein FWH36_00145 [Lentimicrobiaceae bacterium]|nr:hypothetical protein [Lentimicrobiaceae bacterium]